MDAKRGDDQGFLRRSEEMKNKYELRLSANGTDIDLEAIRQLLTLSFRGDRLDVSGNSSAADIRYCTDEPWKVLEFCATFGEIHHISIRNLDIE